MKYILSSLGFLFWSIASHAQTVTKLFPMDVDGRDDYGWSVAIWGDYAFVGAPFQNGDFEDQGAVYIFKRSNTGWVQTQKIGPRIGDSGFGRSVAVHGEFAVVGSLPPSSGYDGAAYIFHLQEENWVDVARLAPLDRREIRRFGARVDIYGDYAVVSGPNDNFLDFGGAVYVYRREGMAWNEVDKLVPRDGHKFDKFGSDLDLRENTLLVGARLNDEERGAAYIFHNEDGRWTQYTRLVASDGSSNEDPPEYGDSFGSAVGLLANEAFISAPDDYNIHGSFSGAFYGFDLVRGQWSETRKFIDPVSDDGHFGENIAVSEQVLFVSKPGENDNRGAVYRYIRSESGWVYQDRFFGEGSLSDDSFGSALDIHGKNLIVGVNPRVSTRSGLAFIYEYPDPPTIRTNFEGLSATVNQIFSFTIEASGSPIPTYLLESGPPGLTLNSDTGTIIWTPTEAGSFEVIIRVENSEGSETITFPINVILGPPAVSVAGPLEIVDPSTFIVEAIVNPNGASTSITFEYGVNEVGESLVPANPGTIDGFDDVLVTATLVSLQEGANYNYRVVAENAAGRSEGSVEAFTAYKSSYVLSASKIFPEFTDSTDYRLVSLPGNVDLGVNETVTGTQDEDWRAFLDNGNPEDFLVPYNSSPQFRFQPGRGFWVLSRTEWTAPNQPVPTLALTPNGTTSIPLRPGWNIIGSVFDKPLRWDLVTAVNPDLPETAMLWAFEDVFYEVEELKPYEGYYLYNGENNALDELVLPFPGMASQFTTLSAKTEAGGSGPSSLSRLSITASSIDSLYSTAYIVLHPDALTSQDHLDQYAPRRGFSAISLSLIPNYETSYGPLSLEARPELQDGDQFELSLIAAPREAISLDVGGLSQFKEWEVILLDRQSGQKINLHNTPQVIIYPDGLDNQYTLLIGSKQFIDERERTITPSDFLLNQNYPNPFSIFTTIEYSLPKNARVRIVIYDLLGRVVEQLVNEVKPAGFHQLTWAPHTSLPEGVYMLKLTTSHGESRTLSLVKSP